MDFGPVKLDYYDTSMLQEVSYGGGTHSIHLRRSHKQPQVKVVVERKRFLVLFDNIDLHIARGLEQGTGAALTEEEKARLTPIIRRMVEIMRDAEIIVRQNNK